MSTCITTPIAITGVACRLPGGVGSLDTLWPLLAGGYDAVSQIPVDRWNAARFQHPRRSMQGHTVSVSAGILDNIYDFDPAFFGISRKEAEAMDPQQRILLELTWEALEDAGIPPSAVAGTDTAVFVGAASPDAGTCHSDDICATTAYSMTGTNLSIIANRIAYIYNFHGPSLTIDTACSSAMYALHQACQTLASGGAAMALAAGVNVLLSPFPFVGFSQAHMLSPDGRCKVFDASGNGYVRSEGAGVLLLQPLDEALAQGRHIHAVIRGIACNSDGRTQGIALPSSQMQEELLREVYAEAQCKPDRLAYLEAHGTGTAAGDPVETAAIGHALGMTRCKPLYMGSVKCNLGHLETASAMAGIMKSLLVLREKRIPPQIHLKKINPAIDLKGLNLRVPLKMTALPQVQGLPLIGVNSFGFGGANGHVLLEMAPAVSVRHRRVHSVPPLFLSARSEASLKSLAGKYADRLEGALPQQYDLAANAVYGREALNHRVVIDGATAEEQVQNLRCYAAPDGGSPQGVTGEVAASTSVQGKAPLTAFVFSGNGGQWAGMGRDLLKNPAFANAVEKAAALMRPLTGCDMLELLQTAKPEDMERTEVAQQLLFLVQVGLCEALKAVGLQAEVALGHSVGEVAAAWYCGALSLKEAVRVIHYRSLYQGKTAGMGKMAAASISAAQVSQFLKKYPDVTVAGINAADAVTLSGNADSLARIGEELQAKRIFFKMLPLDYAFHSRSMDCIKKDLLSSLRGLRSRKPRRHFISTVTGEEVQTACGSVYWWRNVREAVDFEKAVQTALDKGVRYFLEIGPHSILLRYLRSGFKEAESRLGAVEGWVGGTLTRNGACSSKFETAWRSAWAHGWPLDMHRHFPAPACYMSLPGYAWVREDCRLAATPECAGLIQPSAAHPLLGWQTPAAHQWENVLDLESSPWIADHKVGESVYYPAAAFLEMALAAARLYQGRGTPVEMLHTAILRPVIFQDRQAVKLRTVVDSTDGEVRILARPFMRDEAWTLHAKGRAVHCDVPLPPCNEVVAAPQDFGTPVPPEELYRLTRVANMQYGPVFSPVLECWRKQDTVLARFVPQEENPSLWEEGMLIPPPLLDGGLQLLFLLIAAQLEENPAPRLPYWFERCILFRPGRPAFALAHRDSSSRRTVVCSFDLLDAQGNVLLRMEHGHARTVEHLAAPRPAAYITRALPCPHPAAPVPAELPTTQELAAVLGATTPQDPVQERQEAAAPLRELAVLALARQCSSVQAEHCPQALYAYLNGRLEARGADFCSALPDFGDIWRTLMAETPARATCNLLLANARKVLLEGAAPTAAESPLWEEYQRQEYSGTYTFLVETAKALAAALPQGQALQVLEAGTARGGLALRLEDALKGQWRCLTDNDSNMLEKMRLSCRKSATVQYAVWNAEKEAAPCKAHVLLAAHCLHRADNIPLALRHCREALHTGGYLLLAERTPNILDNLFYGQNTDWWTEGEDGQPLSRLLTMETWQEAVAQAGFTDIQLCPVHSLWDNAGFVLLARVPEQNQPQLTSQTAPEAAAKTADIEDAFWLVYGRESVPAPLQEGLERAGHCLQLVRHGESLRLPPEGRWELDSTNATQWKQLWEKLRSRAHAAGKSRITCVHAAAFNADGLDWTMAQQQCASLSQMVRGWEMAGCPATRLFVLTHEAMPLPQAAQARPVQGAAAGLGRVLMNEMPALETRIIDLHGNGAALWASCLREIQQPSSERELVLQGAERFVLRSAEKERDESRRKGNALRLECMNPGRLETLRWLPVSKPEPGPDQVLIQVRAIGLNFRDVMWAMNLLPEEALENGFSGPGLGIECAGVVESVGANVKDLHAGQRVFCFGPHCFGSHVLTTAQAAAPIPDDWSFAEAASVPVTFFTAWYALKHVGQLQAGERVLIHGAAGGVGLAAIQIAMSLDLDVYATAGSEDKRHMLRLLGVEHIYDSRSLRFRDAILADTEGKGVDAVLNSLAGEAMDQSLRLLKPFGRFLELGKRDFYADSPLRLRPFRNNISYFGIDVDQLMLARPELGHRLFMEMMDHFAAGDWRPLPLTRYAADEVETAFRCMQQSRHVGKVVVEAPQSFAHTEDRLHTELLPVRPDGSYLVSGGLGGFGLATARRLAERGAGALILVSRSGARPEHTEVLQELRTLGLPKGQERPVLALAQDVAGDGLHAALDAALAGLPPLRGLVHAAAVLDDVMLSGLTPARLEKVLRPKLGGALALHAWTLDKELDFFVLYSSGTTLLGNPGQANYVAANMALESLAGLRRSMGLPALAVGWGAIADAGMLTRDPAALESLKRVSGIVPQKAEAALTTLEALPASVEAAPALLMADWKRLSRLPLGQSPRMDLLRPEGEAQQGTALSLRERIASKTSKEAQAIITEAVTAAVARILRVGASSLKPATPLADLGMDSLMAMELALSLEEMLDGQSLSGGLNAGVSIRDLSGRLFNILCGQTGEGNQLRQNLEAAHGITVTDELAQAVLRKEVEQA